MGSNTLDTRDYRALPPRIECDKDYLMIFFGQDDSFMMFKYSRLVQSTKRGHCGVVSASRVHGGDFPPCLVAVEEQQRVDPI